ncbi:MAG: ABC transporter substrate-binding protein, partial [Burkholderiaceae bacterium]|nr:ABC transporter substrate-binding protein [Burkholderiaceae bacterium]
MKHIPSQSRLIPASLTRRHALAAGAAGIVALAAPSVLRAQAGPKIRVGYWPIAAGLPFYAAVEKGYFKEAGLDVEPLKFAGAQQIMEAMLAGRCDGSTPPISRNAMPSASGSSVSIVATREPEKPRPERIGCAIAIVFASPA